MTTPLFALVGRPNVGKSTIFNMLTRTRNALVADVSGLTRDRQYGRSYYESPQGEVFPYTLLDTGGISGVEETIDTLIETQVWKAVDEANIVFFVVDGREGLTPFDEAIAERLRRTNKLTVVLVNKAEGQEADLFASDFYRLGFSHLFVISATHNRGFSQLLTGVFSLLKEEGWYPKEEENLEQLADNRVEVETEESAIRLVVFGRPNAGKSTLINHLIGEERLLTSEVAGTTRDSIEIPFRYKAQDFILIDTAGVRRRARVSDKIEKFSVIKSLNAIESAHVILFLFDGEAGLSEQDATLLGYALDAGKALILAVNKWDILEEDEKSWLRQDFTRRYAFIDFTTPLFISALTGRGVNRLLDEAIKAYHSAMEEF